MHAQLSLMEGYSPSKEAPSSGRGERKAGLTERPEKSVLCEREDLGPTKISYVGELPRSATGSSEPTPAQVPRLGLAWGRYTMPPCVVLSAAWRLTR